MRAWKLLLVPAVPVLTGIVKPVCDWLFLRQLRHEAPSLCDSRVAAEIVNRLADLEGLRLVSEQDAARSWQDLSPPLP